jgi:branched-subunit amino acid ABC-type transport system permease component
MDLAVIVIDQIVTSIASLLLISIGLAVIFGMMRVINLAHGEFIMLGGYTVVTAVNAGINVWVASLVLAPLIVGAFGLVIERTIIRFLYGRMIDTMLATWGLSLALVGAVTMVFGNTTSGVSTPLGSMSFGRYELSNYNFAIIGIAALTTLALFCALRFTRFGIIARATMQNAQMVGSLGVNSAHVYAVTFAIGAALSGLAGGMIAPLSGVVPAMGAQYVAKAFITVISGGSAVVAGTLSASTVLGTLDTGMTFLTTPVFGEVSLLVGAVLLVRASAAGHYRPFVQGRNMTGRRAVAWILFLIAAAAAIGLFPQVFELFTVINATIYASMGILTLSLALIWGYCGIISFGQTAFFGLGGYTYAVAAINFGDSTWAIVLGLLIPTLFAALLGYFMFWGRVTDVYLGVITLTVSLILYKLFNATAGDAYHIGKAALGRLQRHSRSSGEQISWQLRYSADQSSVGSGHDARG